MRVLRFVLLMFLALPAFADKATFAGGCFWCMEPPFESLRGVRSVVSGYIGGRTVNPTYEDITGGRTGHYEAVEIVYDPRQITYEKLLEVFWRNIDPMDDTGQFCDKGSQYRSAIFAHNDEQRRLAQTSREGIERNNRIKVVTQILRATPFTRAEEYHQDYARKNPVRYKFYRFNCGRDARLAAVWGRE
ncbi:MAG TPA: peptide-methionine (S)-S-oxide reductase MsrA [Thermoanaerobaculia bacterium]|nr:peptide-methionine (S)-S-oxide reductase MsrA [Thermoanaerobaculia bacterium]